MRERSEKPIIGREYYDRTDYFDGRGTHLTDPESPFHRYRIRRVMELAAPRTTDRVVDLGTGWGTLAFALSPHVAEVVGVDFSARSIALCKARSGKTGVSNVSFLQADAADTGLPGGSWDLVIAADLVEHLYPEQAAGVYREAARLLRPGGRFAVWAPHRGHILEILRNRNILLKRDESHVDYKSMARITGGMEEAGFRIESRYYAPSHLPLLRTAEAIGQSFVPLLRRRIAVLGKKPS